MGTDRAEQMRVEALADQGNAMLRDRYAELTREQLDTLSAMAELFAGMGPVGCVAAQTILMATGNERLRRAKQAQEATDGE